MEENSNNINEDIEETELSHLDKMIGLFTEPGETFRLIGQAPARITDWLIPIIIVLIVSIGSQFLVMNNPVLKMQVVEKQMAAVAENFEKAVKDGNMTQEAADAQMEIVRGQVEQGMSAGMAIQAVIGVVAGIIFFFILASIFFGIFKVAFKSQIDFNHGLVAFGLPGYITVLGVIVTLVYMFVTDHYIQTFDAASIMGLNKVNFGEFLLGKVVPFSIWAFALVGLGYAKMSYEKSSVKYIGLILGVWFVWGVLMYFLSAYFPFFKYFT